MVIIFEENNVEKRYRAIDFFFIIVCMFICTVDRSFRPEKVMRMIDLIEGDLMNECMRSGFVNEKKWVKIFKNYTQKKEYMDSFFKHMYFVSMCVYVAIIGRNLLNEFLEGKAPEESFKEWPTPIVYWCPSGYDNLAFFLLVETIQCTLLYVMLIEGFCQIFTTCLATERVLTDFSTTYMLLESINYDYPESEIVDYYSKRAHSIQDSSRFEKNLKTDLDVIVKCHQNLNSNFKTCADYAAYGTVVLTCIIYSDTVISIYTVMKANNFKVMLNFAVACIFINLIILFSYHHGQKIVNQNDYLRRHLTEVPWVDKPTWFKSSLCIMMRRANIDTELKPYGVYVLNHESFKDVGLRQ
ncbi:hypothetical protein LSTR_LSTR012396 [Laodelphax striatellus]|uniref:Odorant receptor n=1 Tax=Laodelphax striatellus TaxID=195883 RepID=A0A482WU85_LAOST|nr:hypothetical protein LSTR_LSTR012396 [Laodelphax striatellus]